MTLLSTAAQMAQEKPASSGSPGQVQVQHGKAQELGKTGGKREEGKQSKI